jgi:Predicted membrane protein
VKTTRTLLLAAATAAIALPGFAQAPQGGPQGAPPRPPASSAARPHVSLAQAVATAEQAVGGRAFDAELDREKGVLVYEIDLVKDGRAVEVQVDATTGKIISRRQPAGVRLPFTSEHLKVAQSAPRTLSQTITLVENATKGRVSEISLERKGGRYYYEAELAGAQDREVRVDVRTGAITPVIDD